MTSDPLDRALATVATEIARTDTKASALLSADSLLGAFLGVTVSGGHVHATAAVVAAMVLGAALVLAALVIRPRLGTGDRGSFLHWATLTSDALGEALADDHRAGHLITLSALCHRKMRLLRAATDTTVASVAAIAIAAALTATR